MSQKKYLVLEQPRREQFATEQLFNIVSELYQNHLAPFAEDINTVPCSHRKHVFKMIEDAVRVKPNGKLEIPFDSERSEKAALQEMFLETSGAQNARFDDVCLDMKKFFKKVLSELGRVHKFERVVIQNLFKLVDSFHNTITDPETFHTNKHNWLQNFNRELSSLPVLAAANAEVVAGGWQEGLPS